MELLLLEEVLEEMKLFLEHVDSEGTFFRANHAFKYLSLRGDLNHDIPKMIRLIERAKELQSFRPESLRSI